ncbi:MAG: hypothetical protein ACI35S_09875 [Anaeroplasma sp.]
MLKYKTSFIYFLIIFLVFIPFVVYCYSYSITMKELPYLTWIDQFDVTIKYFDGNLNFVNLFTRYGEHGLFGYNLLFLINIKFFSMTTKFDVIINDIFVFLSFFICALIYVISEKRSFKRLIIPLLCMSLFSFSIIQGSSGAMETQVRIGMSITPIYALVLSRIYNSDERMNWSLLLLLIISTLIYINVFGTLYSFAVVPFMFVTIIYAFVTKKTHKINYIIPFLVIIFCCFLYMFEYKVFFFDNSDSNETASIFNGIIFLFKDFIGTILSWFSYNAGGVYGYDIDFETFQVGFLLTGAVISILIIFSIFIFFYKKIYLKSWIPFFIIGYSVFVFVLTRIGRVNSWQYYCAEWYIVHTKFQMVGIIWILSSYLYDKKRNLYYYLNMAINFILIIMLLIGNILISKRLPSVASYYENKQIYLFYSSSEMIVDQNGHTPLLNNLEKTNQMIDYLKKYNLSIYKYNNVGNTIDTAITNGVYPKDDSGLRWISSCSNYIIKPNGETLNIKLYTPDLGHNIKVYIDDTLIINEMLDRKYNEFSLSTGEINSVVKVKIVIDKEIQNDDLCAILFDLIFD